MKSKFKRELHEFLEKERISLESGIVNEITFRLADLDYDENQTSKGFSFDDRFVSDNEKEKIKFSIPDGLAWPKVKKILNLFNIEHDKYEANKDLIIDNNIALEQFVPQFKQLFLKIKDLEPQTIAKYKIISAPILESTALATLKQYIKEANEILLSENLRELTDSWKSLVEFIILLSGQMSSLQKYPLFYKDILQSVERANSFLIVPEVIENKALVSKLKMIIEGIELYSRYHRNESVLALLAFNKEFKELLDNYRISTKKCDILEDIMLNFAGANQKSTSVRSSFSTGGDPARLTITFSDIDKENMQKVVNYLVKMGDETACEGYGSRKYGSAVAEKSMHAQSAFMVQSYGELAGSSGLPETEPHTIEMDGNFFYKEVFPQIKKQIEQMDKENLLDKYQKLCKDLFPQENIRVSSVSMFQDKKTIGSNIVSETPQLTM